MPSLAELRKQKLKEQEESRVIQEEKFTPGEKEITLVNLKPPKPPEKEEIQSFEIDWNKVAQSSDFKRAVYLALEGKAWRGTNENLEKELNKKIEILRDPEFSNVIKELKDKFKNGFIKPSQMKK